MPTVPVSRETSVRTNALPSVRVNTQQPLSTFGGGDTLTQSSNAARGLNNELSGKAFDIMERARKDAEDIRNMQTALDMSKVKDDLGIKLNEMRGQDAMAAPDVISKEWKSRTDEIYNGLSSQYQKEYFQKERNAQAIELYGKVNNHVAKEGTQLAKNVYTATVDNQVKASADHQDTDSLNQHIDGIKSIVASYGKKFGDDQEIINTKSDKAASAAVDNAVTARLHATGDQKQAQELLDSVSHNIPTKDYMEIAFKLDKGAETLRNITTRNINITQNKNALDVLDNLQNNNIDWTNLNKINDLDVPEPFKMAAKGAVLKQIEDISNNKPKSGRVSTDDADIKNEEDELFASHLADVLNSGDQEKIITTMSDTLRNYGKGTISQEHMNILVQMAVAAGKTRPIKIDANNGTPVDPKQIPIDAGAKAILGMNIKDPQVFSDYMENLKTMPAQEAQDAAVRSYVIKKNPGIKAIPAEGQLRYDRNGNKAIVFPDGSYKLLDGAKKASEKK